MSSSSVLKPARQASAPWYREPWPWILMGLPMTAVVAGIATLVLAVKSDDGVVAADYYKRGLAINETLARENMARHLGLRGEITTVGNELTLHLSAREGISLPERLRLTFLHPTKEGEDQVLALSGQGGVYRATMAPLQAGSWDVSLEDEGGSWRFVQEVKMPAAKPVSLEAPPV
ncbi:MAG: FixH family protein [Rhodocyclaceae bacterium]